MKPRTFETIIVENVDGFKSVFTPGDLDCLLLCYEVEADDVTSADLLGFERAVCAAAEKYGARLRLYLWNCGTDAFIVARAQLGKVKGMPLLLVVYRQEVSDVFCQSLSGLSLQVGRVCERLAFYQQSDGVVVVSSPLSSSSQGDVGGTESVVGKIMTVDVARLVDVGKRLMNTGRAEYAEKVFHRALAVLDTVTPNCSDDMRVMGSAAMCLAWVSLAIMVQGKCADSHLRRLQGDYREFCTEFGSDAARACGVHRMIGALTVGWTGDTCSQKRLREILSVNPKEHDYRCALVVTLFLCGDLERCLTEALKLHSFGVPFAAVAMSAVRDYIGPEHPLFVLAGVSQ